MNKIKDRIMKKLNKTVLAIALTGACLVSSGCYSVMARASNAESMVYPGVQYKSSGDTAPAEQIVRLIDLPVSFGFDTALLPFDILGVALGGSSKEATPEGQ